MANNVYTGPTMDRLQSYNFPFVVTDRDGNVDTTSAVVLSSTTGNATIALDPTDNRRAIVTGHSAGGATLSITKTGAAKLLQINQTITDIDLSGVDLGAGGFSTPQPPH